MNDAREYVRELAEKARHAARTLARTGTAAKNEALRTMADALEQNMTAILAANNDDVERARQAGTRSALIDRLMLNEARIKAMADGLRAVAELPDPVGETVSMTRRPNGLDIGQVRVPLGVIGMIYEARPNVTADAAGLCLKAGNAVVLRGGADALSSNKAIADALKQALVSVGLPAEAVQLVERPEREAATAMMQASGLIDVLIPRGGPGLIKSVIETATVPVIETGAGNCHTYVDEFADVAQAVAIAVNAKVQRPSVCNAMETLLVHEAVAETFLPKVAEALREHGVDLRGCEKALALVPGMNPAVEDDWFEEYLDLVLAVRVVPDLDTALDHIARCSTGHSEAIISRDYGRIRRFLQEVDAAAVYVNASTRFTDGYEFGLGAEIGISTQKLHARGPMGLHALTSVKHVIYGDGHVRG